MSKIIALMFVTALGLGAQPAYRYNQFTRTQDISGDLRLVPVGSGALASRPATCTTGQVYMCVGTGCTNGSNLHWCRGTDTWQAQGGASASTDLSDSAGLVRGAASLTTVGNPVSVGSAGTLAEDTSIAKWRGPYTVTKVANGVGGCTGAGGCWTVTGQIAVAAEADESQDVTIATLPANYMLSDIMLSAQTVTACTGADTITTTGWIAGDTNGGIVTPADEAMDLMAAVADTNVAFGRSSFGRTTKAASPLTFNVTVTGESKTIQSIAAGCSLKIWLNYAVLPQ